jgi:hypothetical protein
MWKARRLSIVGLRRQTIFFQGCLINFPEKPISLILQSKINEIGFSGKYSLAGNTAKGLVRQSHYLLSPEAFYTPSYFLQTSSL